jgi:Flp pilus assembly pilin Flp
MVVMNDQGDLVGYTFGGAEEWAPVRLTLPADTYQFCPVNCGGTLTLIPSPASWVEATPEPSMVVVMAVMIVCLVAFKERRRNMKRIVNFIDRVKLPCTLAWQLRFWKDTRGQDFLEYALLTAFIAVACGAILPPVLAVISNVMSNVTSTLNAVAAS